MKKNRFFNLVLITSFLLSNLGMTPTNQTGVVSSNISAKIDGMFERIGSWLDGMRVVSFETGTTPVDIPSTTLAPFGASTLTASLASTARDVPFGASTLTA